MPIKKKKIKKPLNLKEKKTKSKIDFEADAGKGLENFDKATVTSVYWYANQVKNYKQLEEFIEKYGPTLSPADIATAAMNHLKNNWHQVKILKDPEHKGSVLTLIQAVDDRQGGAKKVWNEYNNQTAHWNERTGALAEFIIQTGYKIAKSAHSFQEHMTEFKEYYGLKKVGKYKGINQHNTKDQEFSILTKPEK